MNCAEARNLLADRLTADLEKAAGVASKVEIGINLDRHLAACAECRATLAELNASLAAWKSDLPWAPPASYWNNLLPRIHGRIEENTRRKAHPVARLLSVARWAAAPVAALTIILILSNPRSTVSFPTTQEIALQVRNLPDAELTGAIEHAQWEGEYSPIFPDSSSFGISEDDKAEIVELLNDAGTQFTNLQFSAMPLSSIQPESDAALFASADDVFDAIQPRLEQSIASIK